MIITQQLLRAISLGCLILAGGCAEEIVDPPYEEDVVIEDVVTPQLPGAWSTACLVKPNSLSVRVTYLREVISFTATSISFDYGEFTDPGCSVVAISNPGTIKTGAWTLGREVVTTDGLTALEFDYAVAAAGATAVLTRTILYLQDNTIYLGVPAQSATRPNSLALEVPYSRL